MKRNKLKKEFKDGTSKRIRGHNEKHRLISENEEDQMKIGKKENRCNKEKEISFR